MRLLPALLPEEDGKDHAVAPAVHVVPADVVRKVRGAVRLQLLPVHGHGHALRLRNRADPRVKAIHPHEGDLLVLEEAADRLRLLLLKVVGKAHAVDVFLPARRADGLQGAEGPVQAVDHVHAADLDVVGLAVTLARAAASAGRGMNRIAKHAKNATQVFMLSPPFYPIFGSLHLNHNMFVSKSKPIFAAIRQNPANFARTALETPLERAH